MMNKRLWQASHILAAELAQRGCDPNLIRTAAAYLQAHPNANFLDWLERLVRLGDTFRSSDQTERYRQELWAACGRLKDRIGSNSEWQDVLGWSARLYSYYDSYPSKGLKWSDARGFQIPPLPPRFKPPRPTLTRPRPAESQPPVPDKTSAAAEDIFALLQKKWQSSDKK